MENDKYKYCFGLQVLYGKELIKGLFLYKKGRDIEQEEIITGNNPLLPTLVNHLKR